MFPEEGFKDGHAFDRWTELQPCKQRDEMANVVVIMERKVSWCVWSKALEGEEET